MSSSTLDALESTARHLVAEKYFHLASFVMLIYDHMLTFDQEVDRIWKQKLSGASILFLINRYVTPIQYIVILIAFHDPNLKNRQCDNLAAFEGASSVTLIAICQLIMILRVYALYGHSIPIVTFLMILWAAQIAVSAIGLHTGYRVPLPPMLVGCILAGNSTIFPSLWVFPLATDSCIFILTLWRTREYLKDSGMAPTIYIFIRDGALYFLVIFVANLMNTLIYFLAPLDLRALGASFSQLIMSIMISRLVLNLRSVYGYDPHSESGSVSPINIRRGVPERSFLTRTIGNLGEDVSVSGYTTRVVGDSEDKTKVGIPLANVSRRSEVSGNIL